MGAVVLATAALASLSAGFAMHMALNAPLGVAVVIGIGWGLVILAIDRALMVGMANQTSLSRNLAIAAPRVVLALILGTVISTPLTLQIFHREIDAQIQNIQREAADNFSEALAADDRFTVIPQLENQVAETKARVTSNGGADPSVAGKQRAYDAALAKYQELQAAAQCELNGNCGTQRAGTGDAYYAAKEAADRQLAVANAAQRELAAAAAQSKDQAGIDQTQAEERLADLSGERQRLQDEFDARNADNTGLLIRLEALDRISTERALLGWAHALLWAMFTCIELLPVIVKLLMNIGGGSEYDRVQKEQDGGDADVFAAQKDTWKEIQRKHSEVGLHEAQKDTDVERARIEGQKAQDIDAVHKVLEVQGEAVDQFLEVWRDDALQRIREQRDDLAHRLAQGRAATPAPTVAHRNGNATNNYVRTAQLPDRTVL
ncbi:DUF4407 domain-containing protein [Mycobacterium sp. TJFP1]